VSIRENVGLAKIFINPATNETYKENDRIIWPSLGDTLEMISNEGAEAFYNGRLSKKIVDENNHNGRSTFYDSLKTRVCNVFCF
jgi:gamma-glutamyltranspeptidase